jgi:hypothetical protein
MSADRADLAAVRAVTVPNARRPQVLTPKVREPCAVAAPVWAANQPHSESFVRSELCQFLDARQASSDPRTARMMPATQEMGIPCNLCGAPYCPADCTRADRRVWQRLRESVDAVRADEVSGRAEMVSLKVIRLCRPDRCACGVELAASDRAVWDRVVRAVRCLGCVESARADPAAVDPALQAAEPAQLDRGVAGVL